MGRFFNVLKEEAKNKKNLAGILVLGILVLAIPLGIDLVKRQQIIKSRAATGSIVFKGDNVKQVGGQWVVLDPQKPVDLELTSPFGAPSSQAVQPPNLQQSLLSKGLVSTVYAAGKTCIYSQGNQCYWGNCLDGSQNCDTNRNCGYVSGVSSGTRVECPSSGGGNPPPGGGNPPPGGSNPQACTGSPSYAPSQLGINNSSVCDRLHKYFSCGKTCTKGGSTSECPENTDQEVFINKTGSNWCYNSRCLQLRYIGDGKERSCAAGETGVGPCSGDACTDCILKTKTDILPFFESNGWDTKCGNQKAVVTEWCKIDSSSCTSLKSNQCSTQCKGSSPGSPGSPGSAVTTVSFKIAENAADLAGAPDIDYTLHPMPYQYLFKDKTAGVKSILVEFKGSDNQPSRLTAQIKLLGPNPAISGCVLSFEGNNTVLNLTGQNFGSGKGTVKNGDTSLTIKNWKNDSVAVFLSSSSTEKTVVTLTNSDGQSGDGTCSASSQLALGAKVFCRAPASHQTDNVDLVLAGAFEGGTKTKQKIKIDKDGVVQGLTQKLESGKNYKLSLKAPGSLRKTASFTAGDGTTNLPNFILPVGDIFPVDGGDGVINTLDKSELNRQWNIASNVTNRSGDFNQDSRVNSVDWACMRYDFNDSDSPEPDPGGPPASSPTAAPTAAPTANPPVSIKGPCQAGTCVFDTRAYFVMPDGTTTESVTAYGKFWNWTVGSDTPWSSADLTTIPRYAGGPCKDKSVGTCVFDTRASLADGTESITAYGSIWNFDIKGNPVPIGNGILSSTADLTTIPRYANTGGPCNGKGAGTCVFDTRAYFVMPDGTTTESVTAYGKFWNWTVGSDTPWSSADLTTIPRYAGGPCKDKSVGTCVFDTRASLADGTESITAYGSIWNFDSKGNLVSTGVLSDIDRYKKK